ncbi:MAG: glycosyltransferase [Gemmatales bacterium]|nr:glycosyltransferase [Gemmatales bacterium]MDW8386157.1 glycosyltransferase [Gemmatales bacterium]
MSETIQSRYRMRIGIWCPTGSLRLADDEPTDQGLRRFLQALSETDSAPQVVLHGPNSKTQYRFPPDLLRRLDLRIVPRSPSFLQTTLWPLLRAWLRKSETIRLWSEGWTDAWTRHHERIVAAWHEASPSLRRLIFLALLTVWPMVALARIASALLWGLAFPLWMLDRVVRRLDFMLCRRFTATIHEANCCVWLVPHPYPWPLSDVPAVLLVPHGQRFNPARLPDHLHGMFLDPTTAPRSVFVAFSDKENTERSAAGWYPQHVVEAPPWSDARLWLDFLARVRDHAPQAVGLDLEALAPWPEPREPAFARDGRYKALLFLQIPWGGGNWEHTRELVAALDRISKRDGQLRVELAVHVEQTGTSLLPRDVPLHRCRFNLLERATAMRFGSEVVSRLGNRPEPFFCFFSGAAEAALAADVWLALSDRFPLPLLPARPYAVVVHDMIHRHVPEAFHAAYFRNLHRGVWPTLRHAEAIITTSEPTKSDVLAEYDLVPERVVVVPVACEPHRRFGSLPSGLVPLPRRDFILNVTNASPHKGADLMLEAYAELKRRLGPWTPLLVLCGINTQYLSARHRQPGPAFWERCRQLQRSLGLVERQDVVFLGPVTDMELKDLYCRCQVVVNAARYDNGTYCLIEAAWFGKPTVSTCYPGVESLVERFGLPVRFAAGHDPETLADALTSALACGEMTSEQLCRIRSHLEDPRFSVEVYAQRIYDLLLAMAKASRREARHQVGLTETAARPVRAGECG